jgi:phosphopantetheine--protein transferase-like protein
MPENGEVVEPVKAAEVHLWLANLDTADAYAFERYRAWFTPGEKTQFSGFLSERRRREFILGRGLARQALAHEHSVAPELFEFEADPQGRLSIRTPTSATATSFNISHTADWVACGVCRNFEIGLDVERIAARVEPLLIAQRFFNEAEVTELLALDDSSRLERFFALWTLKEALAKAHGLGLAAPLHASRFEISANGSFAATSAYSQFRQGAALALTSFTPQHRLAICVLCDETTEVQIVIHPTEFDTNAPASGLTWVHGRLRNTILNLD